MTDLKKKMTDLRFGPKFLNIKSIDLRNWPKIPSLRNIKSK